MDFKDFRNLKSSLWSHLSVKLIHPVRSVKLFRYCFAILKKFVVVKPRV
jgi:hypothetical protein